MCLCIYSSCIALFRVRSNYRNSKELAPILTIPVVDKRALSVSKRLL
jgi:hypothetical protein